MSEGVLPEVPDNYKTIGYSPQRGGCTADGCTTQDTISLDGRFGRRCWQHSPWRTLAREGKRAEAWAALRAWLGTRGAA